MTAALVLSRNFRLCAFFRSPLLHRGTKQLVDASLIAFPFRFQPGQYVGVEANGNGLLYGPKKSAHYSAAPVSYFGNIGYVDFVVLHFSKRGDFFTSFCSDFEHRFLCPEASLSEQR